MHFQNVAELTEKPSVNQLESFLNAGKKPYHIRSELNALEQGVETSKRN